MAQVRQKSLFSNNSQAPRSKFLKNGSRYKAVAYLKVMGASWILLIKLNVERS